MMLSIIDRVLIAVVVFIAYNAAEALLHHRSIFGAGTSKLSVGKSLAIGLATGLANYLPTLSQNPYLSAALFVMMMLGITGLILWWQSDNGGSEFVEMIPFSIMALMFSFAARPSAIVLGNAIGKGGFLTKLIKNLPMAVLAGVIGYLVASTLFFRYEKEGKKPYRTGGWVSAILAGALCLVLIATDVPSGAVTNLKQTATSAISAVRAAGQGAIDQTKADGAQDATEDATEATAETSVLQAASAAEQAAREEEAAAETAAGAIAYEKAGGLMLVPEDSPWTFRHHAVLKDNYDENGDRLEGDALKEAKINDYDFGLNPLDEVFKAKIASGGLAVKDLANKTEVQLYALVTVDDLMEEFVNEMKQDPALGAACMAWFDANMNTRLLGKFFSEYKDHPDAWMETINAAKEEWIENPNEYYEVLKAFIEALTEAAEITIRHQTFGLDDQMYMFGFSDKFVPDVIVMESKDHEGFLLTFTYLVKGTEKVTFSYRINCGFQPTNVGEVMNVTPRSNPNKPGESGGGNTSGKSGGGNNSGKSGGGNTSGKSGGGDPVITNSKDVANGTPQQKNQNDVKGPGPGTNDGVGAQYSRVELPTGSTFLNTFSEYKEEVRELKDINEGPTSRPAGTPNTPTQSAPANTTVDSNAGKGTGYGGADDGSRISAPVTGKDQATGAQDTVKGEVGGAEDTWEGPPL